jgi:hypothetical protein
VVERLSTELQRLRNDREKLQNERESLLWNLNAPPVQAEGFSSTTFEVAEFPRSSLKQRGNEICPVCGQAIHVEDPGRNLPGRIHSLDQEIVKLNTQIGAEMDRTNQLERSLVPLEHEIISKARSFEEIQMEVTASDAEAYKGEVMLSSTWIG